MSGASGAGPRTGRAAAGAAVVLTVALLAGGCGLPGDGRGQRVPPEQVPSGLLGPTSTSTTTPTFSTARASVYLVDDQQQLVPVAIGLDNAPVRPLLQDLLTRLAVGPSERDRARGLLTDLSPGTVLSLRSLEGGTATVQIISQQDPAPGRLPVAVAQVVLTATSVEGVERVQFVQADGQPQGVPVAQTGDLSTQPVTASEVAALVAPDSPPRVSVTPLPGDAPASAPATTTAGP
ncbi:GerMN domain-containing protein [Lapillicoccus jejuensis]|uniref:Sporulation and spore germination protein n=1 Tax=Lapillicoccus jejuensis TaxID=402171 RepID=A0A542DWU1_9MICO|nr:GerMN domain-containing protein [Lapillicoccus jejuensis]TQJ07559.1 sporulation and spore germination protein [Lapillicoccus jejuensis]